MPTNQKMLKPFTIPPPNTHRVPAFYSIAGMKKTGHYLMLGLLVGCICMSCGKKTAATKTPVMAENKSTKKFFTQDGEFKIQFEQEPTAYTQDVPYEQGKLRMNYFIYEKGINLIFCVSYADYPDGFMKNKTPADFLSTLLVDYIDSQKSGLETQKMVTVNTWPGIYFKASNSDIFVYGEYVLKQNRLFQITVTKEGSYHNEAESNAFIQSLEIL
jgi:hypothetical protein